MVPSAVAKPTGPPDPGCIHMLESAKLHELVGQYYAAIRSMDGGVWAATFSEDAIIEDPVGEPPVSGGRSRFADFYARHVNEKFQKFDVREQTVFVQGNRVATSWLLNSLDLTDRAHVVEGMSLISYDDNGLITSLRVFWNPG